MPEATWFHGIRASIMPIPHVSVIPENTEPRPDESRHREKRGMERAEQQTEQYDRSGSDADLPLQRHALLAADNRQARFDAGQCASLDVDDVRQAGREQPFASLAASAS